MFAAILKTAVYICIKLGTVVPMKERSHIPSIMYFFFHHSIRKENVALVISETRI